MYGDDRSDSYIALHELIDGAVDVVKLVDVTGHRIVTPVCSDVNEIRHYL